MLSLLPEPKTEKENLVTHNVWEEKEDALSFAQCHDFFWQLLESSIFFTQGIFCSAVL